MNSVYCFVKYELPPVYTASMRLFIMRLFLVKDQLGIEMRVDSRPIWMKQKKADESRRKRSHKSTIVWNNAKTIHQFSISGDILHTEIDFESQHNNTVLKVHTSM